METEVNKAIVKVKTVITNANAALKELEDLKSGISQSSMFDGEEKATFIRFDVQSWPYSPNRFQPGTWMQLLDSNKSKLVTKNRQGFQLTQMRKNQTVDSTKATADMLFAKDVASRELAETILDSLAKVKYPKVEKVKVKEKVSSQVTLMDLNSLASLKSKKAKTKA